ncbi:AMP-binding protein [bacterium]|nr:AMP-binding protein [bacterium]
MGHTTHGPLARLGHPDSLGIALDAATRTWADETCLIEANRDAEKARFTFAEFRTRGLELAGWLDGHGFAAGDRAAIILTNQSKWHLSAFALMHRGAVLVPLDFKLSGDEHAALLAHCRPRVLVIEWYLYRALSACAGFADLPVEHVLVTEAPPNAELASPPHGEVHRWEDCTAEAGDEAPRPRTRDDIACIVYSSGTGGRPKGCQLTHGNYLAQLDALTQLHPFGPGHRYLSILPTNHAIDFMVGFIGPYVCGAAVVHLRTIRPEFVRDAFVRYRITHVALVPMVLKNLQAGLVARFDALPAFRRIVFDALRGLYGLLAGGRPNPRLARRLLRPVHDAFGGQLEAIFVGGAYSDPGTLRFFHGLGLPVANGYGLTEAGTAITLDRLDPPRPETVGAPLPGIEVEIREPSPDGVGEVTVRSPMVMRGYLDDPELTAETIRDGWLWTGDLGRLDDGCLQLLGRRKNMIVTEGGKNVYPEDVESAFDGIDAEEYCVFAAHYLWPAGHR